MKNKLVLCVFLTMLILSGTVLAFDFTGFIVKIRNGIIPTHPIINNLYPTPKNTEKIPTHPDLKLCIDADQGLNYSISSYVSANGKLVRDACVNPSRLDWNLDRDLGRIQVTGTRIANLGVGQQYTGSYGTFLNEEYCTKDGSLFNIATQQYDCSIENKTCFNGLCFSPKCTQMGKGVSYIGATINSLSSVTSQIDKETSQLNPNCKDSNTITEYGCVIQSGGKFQILDKSIYGKYYVVNPNQQYPQAIDRRCGSITDTITCPALSVGGIDVVDVSIDSTRYGCLTNGENAVCADDLSHFSQAQKDEICNPSDSTSDGRSRPRWHRARDHSESGSSPNRNTGGSGSNDGTNPDSGTGNGAGSGTNQDNTQVTTGFITCSDSDNGDEPNYYGTLTLKDQNNNIIETQNDRCISNNDKLKEWYCLGNDKACKKYKCTKKCENGLCSIDNSVVVESC